MSAGLDASIVTPGSTAPDVSRTVPARLCAEAKLGAAPTIAITTNNRISIRFMSENLHNRLRYEVDPSSKRRECADYGPFDYGCQGRKGAPRRLAQPGTINLTEGAGRERASLNRRRTTSEQPYLAVI